MRALLIAALLASGCGSNRLNGTPNRTPEMLVVSPAVAEVSSKNGVAEAAQFSVVVVYKDGTSDSVTDAEWTASALGAIDKKGLFTASGRAAGTANVTASYRGLTGTAQVHVTVADQYVAQGTPSDAPSHFDPSTAHMNEPDCPVLDYPLRDAVMPSSVKAPDVQWEVGNADDLYHVSAIATDITVDYYVVHSGGNFTFDWAIPENSWTALKSGASNTRITFLVDRYVPSTQTLYRGAPVAITVVGGSVSGAIYYWDLSEGKMMQITDAGRKVLIPNPPRDPKDANNRCVACHTVSHDGRYLAAELWGGGRESTVFDLSADLTPDPAPMVVTPGVYASLFATFNPTASRLLINNDTSLKLLDTMTGVAVPTIGTPLPTKGAAHPAWSPDGSLIAYIANIDGGWAVDYKLGDLAVIPVTGPDTFGDTRIVRPADGMANSWPSFSPDSNWIAFARGTNSRGKNENTVYPGNLFLVQPAGGTPIELAAADGGAHNTYLPSFSPFDAGGYFWLAFYSLRDYGNSQAGTKGTGRRQLWVTAISQNEVASDPSHVPYWLPDQDSKTENMSAFWSLSPPLQ